MPARKINQGIRSGRFKTLGATGAAIPIVKGESGGLASFRIHNSGDSNFRVDVATLSPELVRSGCSLDVLVKDDDTVTIRPIAGNPPFQGNYDLIEAGSDCRAGRFEANGTIILNQPGIYRLINGGDNPIVVSGGVTGNVPKNSSLDFSVAAVSSDEVTSTNIQGVYERLDTRSTVRSGRFKYTVQDSGGGTAVVLPVIDLRAALTTPLDGLHRYRIINAGKTQLRIKSSADGTNWSDIATVQRDQSFDFQMSNAKNTIIGVVDAVSVTISGVIDYLGLAK